MYYQNVLIRSTGIYHPKNKIYNDNIIEHFSEIGVKVEGILNHLNRRKRYFADLNETSLSMAYEAAKKAMDKINMKPDELDMIVFVSDTPEYTAPSNALKLNQLLHAENAHIIFDMNSNCVGLITAMDVVSRYVQSKNRVENILLVGSLLISRLFNKDDTIMYPNMGDCAAAVILRNEQEEYKRGFLDSTFFTDSSYHDKIVFPKCGYSKMTNNSIPEHDKKFSWIPFDTSFLAENWTEIIERLLERNELKPSQISNYIFSQFSDPENLKTLEKLGVMGHAKYYYLGKEYGYTGVTSPIVVLDRMWECIAVKDTHCIFCSIGAGYTLCSLLYKF